jgi:hypothetical protein
MIEAIVETVLMSVISLLFIIAPVALLLVILVVLSDYILPWLFPLIWKRRK